MLDLSLFAKPAFAGASIAAFALSASMFSMFLYLTLYIQNILGYSPLESGLRFLPVTLLSFFVAPISGKLAERARDPLVPRRRPRSASALGLLLMSGLEPGDDWTALLAGFMVAGGGIGLVNPPLATAAVGVVEPQRAGMASGINSTFRQVGIATGIAGLGAIFQHLVASDFLARVPASRLPQGVRTGAIADFISFGGAQRVGNDALARAAEHAFVDGLNDILVYAAILAFVGAVLATLLTRPQDFVAHGIRRPLRDSSDGMQPLFEHRLESTATRRACSSSRATARAWCCCTAAATRPTRGGRCWRGSARATGARSPSTCRASGTPRGSGRARSCRSSTRSRARSWSSGPSDERGRSSSATRSAA